MHIHFVHVNIVDKLPRVALSPNTQQRNTITISTDRTTTRGHMFTVLAIKDGCRSAVGGAPIVRFFVAVSSAASLVSMLESASNTPRWAWTCGERRGDTSRKICSTYPSDLLPSLGESPTGGRPNVEQRRVMMSRGQSRALPWFRPKISGSRVDMQYIYAEQRWGRFLGFHKGVYHRDTACLMHPPSSALLRSYAASNWSFFMSSPVLD